MSKTSFVVIGLIQAVVGVAWGAWVVTTADGLLRYTGLVPTIVLFVGATYAFLATRVLAETTDLSDQLQRIKTMQRLDEKALTLKERLAHFETLKQWGIISEQELLDKRRALLDLEQPQPLDVSAALEQWEPATQAEEPAELAGEFVEPAEAPQPVNEPAELRGKPSEQERLSEAEEATAVASSEGGRSAKRPRAAAAKTTPDARRPARRPRAAAAKGSSGGRRPATRSRPKTGSKESPKSATRR